MNRGRRDSGFAAQGSRFGLHLVTVLLALAPLLAQARGTEIILSPDRGAVAVDRETLRAIFTTRLRQWPDGTPVRVFVMPDDSGLHDQFCREQLGMYPYVLREVWDRLQFTGTGLVPTVVRSESEMRSKVHDTPGAIGYVPAAGTRDDGAAAAAVQAQRNAP